MTEGPLLFQPVTIKSVTARNRIVASPMSQYLSHNGSPTDWHIAHMGRYAIGGAGIVFYEETAVEARGRKTHHCAGLYRADQVPEYRRIARFLRGIGAVPAMQLGHAGGGGSGHSPREGRGPLTAEDAANGFPPWQTISSSPVAVRASRAAPREMDRDDIATVIRAWATAAARTLEAEFDICEIHGAHGYLIQQFLSPLINRRTDGYGGDRKGRMRLALEITEAVRAVWPEHKPLFFRVSSIDGRGGSWALEDTVALAVELKARGVDLIDCSSGGLTGSSGMPAVPQVPGLHVPFARAVKAATGMLTMAPGLVTTGTQAEGILQAGDVDLIGMARELMYCSEWPVHAARDLGVADHLGLFPEDFAFRLRARAAGVNIHEPTSPAPRASANK
jgi:2,4-dienoyl-CoA reductase-like NADH-dependent reductase (Old Yellow Enzyme family)